RKGGYLRARILIAHKVGIFARWRLILRTKWEYLRAGGSYHTQSVNICALEVLITHKLGIFAGYRFLSHTKREYLRAGGSYHTQIANICALRFLSHTKRGYLRAGSCIAHKLGIFVGWRFVVLRQSWSHKTPF